jgi:uncharacterized protein (DUF2062 family)
MPLYLFKKLSRQRHHLSTRWYMRPFAFVFGDAAYWSMNRRSVTRAVALGFFLAFLPPPIPHTLVAVAAAIALRVNIPVTMASTFITNPLTMVPVYYAAYRSGCYALGLAPLTRLPGLNPEQWLPAVQGPVLQPFLLGCLLLGLALAVVAYILLGLSWHISLVYKLFTRRQLRRHREQNRDQQ